MERRFLFEADDDDNTNGGANNATTGTNTANDTNNNGPDEGFGKAADEDTNTDTNNGNTDNSNDTNNDTNTNNNQEQNDQDKNSDDYTINTNTDNNGTDTGEDNGQAGGDTKQPDDEVEDTSVESDIKKQERELFDSLSPEEQKMKNTMLKQLYVDLYNNCGSIITKLNDVSTEVDSVNAQIKRSLTMLFELKQMIRDYFSNMYESKSYIENDIMFNRYLSMLNAVKNITKEIDKACGDDTE